MLDLSSLEDLETLPTDSMQAVMFLRLSASSPCSRCGLVDMICGASAMGVFPVLRLEGHTSFCVVKDTRRNGSCQPV